MTKPGQRVEQDELRARMRAVGMSHDEIAVEFARRYRLRPRAAHRVAHGWTQQQAAGHINAHAARIGLDPDGTATMTAPRLSEMENWPLPLRRRPTPQILALLAEVYDTSIHNLLDLDDREHLAPADTHLIDTVRRTGRARPELSLAINVPSDTTIVESDTFPYRAPVIPVVANGAGTGNGQHDLHAELLDVGRRLQYFAAPTVHTTLLDYLDSFIDVSIESYEVRGPAALMPHVTRQRTWVQTLVEGWQLPRDRRRLLGIAARLSGLAGYMAVNLGDFPLARAYCTEAFTIAVAVEDGDFAAWIRGTESLCEYYAGDYRLALEHARDGQGHAAGGPQTIRLVVNGEARALGQLGDREGVREAVGRAFDLAERSSLPDGMSPCISFDTYSLARIAANAATAHVGTGEAALVHRYAQMASDVLRTARSPWSDILVALDVATALTAGDDPDPERAATLGIEALTRAGSNPIESIRQRGRELVRRTTPWRSLPRVTELAEASRALTRGLR
ncbi:helix-turn-helix transcriptional regulator [Frankia sp. Cas4]|uniref:helix-turn-helix domain-containing protein n=1 Tax=Frankia sp. Cas4 TaxID=3073927 RepID=UPI002AD52B94|nr:helix-turn-helix transcriptional regulator [Frankia sp. Cas4]